MSFIPQHYTTQFDAAWQHLAQAKMNKCREYVVVETVRGKEKSFNQLGPAEFQPITTRAGETRITDSTGAKRWLRPYPHDVAHLFDEWDETFLGEVVLPQSATVESHSFGYNRLVDRTIINAALGTAYTGEIGVTPVILPAGQLVPVNYVESGSATNSGLTIGKLRQMKFLLDDAEIDEDDPRFIALGAKQLQDLLRTTEITSSDYNTVKALVEGDVDTFLGFKFKRVSSSFLPYNTGTDVRTIVGWVRSGVYLADSGRRVHIDIRVDKSHSLQIRSVAAVGATRAEEIKVVAADCDQSP
jgi:hypothetical protein